MVYISNSAHSPHHSAEDIWYIYIRVPAILPDPFQKTFAISVALPTKFGDIADEIYQVLAMLEWLGEMAETINNFLF